MRLGSAHQRSGIGRPLRSSPIRSSLLGCTLQNPFGDNACRHGERAQHGLDQRDEPSRRACKRASQPMSYSFVGKVRHGANLAAAAGLRAFRLYGRARHGAVRTEDTAVALFWFQHGFAGFALVEILARVRRHSFSVDAAAGRACYGRFKDQVGHGVIRPCRHSRGRAGPRRSKGRAASTPGRPDGRRSLSRRNCGGFAARAAPRRPPAIPAPSPTAA